MKKINKNTEPNSLRQYRCKDESKYDGPQFSSIKEVIRQQLLDEQGYLCAYCMSRIYADNMKVEHFRSQSSFPDMQLDYSNMLGCCIGGEGNKSENQTCDTKKGNRELKFSPAFTLNIEDKIEYNKRGTISSTDTDFNDQINTVLNLNNPRLKQNRAEVLSGFQSQLVKTPGVISKAKLQYYIKFYSQKNDKNQYHEYCGIILNYLNKKLSRGC